MVINLRIRSFIHFIIPLILLIVTPTASFADADNIFKENNKAVVVVVAYNEKGEPISQGSGFVVREDGAIVTNYHVISNARGIKVKAGDKVLDVDGLIHTDKENDLVILKVKGEKLPIVKLGDIATVSIGEKVYVISSPEGLENTISDGILSGIREITSDRKILQITAPISPGSSGGPVFNKDGEVIGIATFLIKEAQNLNFAMPVNLVKDKIKSKKVIAVKESNIEDYKKSAGYWFYIGLYYGEAGEWNDAVTAYKQAIKIKPDFAEAYLYLGVTYGMLGMDKDAIEAYKQAIRIKPDDAKAHYILGRGYASFGMVKEAIKAYKQAIRITPDDAEVHLFLGRAYGKSSMDKEAIEEYKQAIRINPNYAEAHLYLGVTYAYLDMAKEAMDAHKQAIRINPDYAEAHFYLGLDYIMTDDRGSALEEYKILKDLDKELANELFNMIYE